MKLLGPSLVAPVARLVFLPAFAAVLSITLGAGAQTQPPPPGSPTAPPAAPPPLQVPGAATTALPITPPPPTTAPPAAAPPPPGVPPPVYPGVPGTATPPPAPPPGSAPPPAYYPPPPGAQPAPPPQGAAPPGYPPPPPGYAYYPAPPPYAPPPPPKPRIGVHLHDRFYLRLALGVTQASGSIRTPSISRSANGQITNRGETAEGNVSGPGAAFDLAVGWTVTRGLAIAGFASGRSISNANVTFKTGSTTGRTFNEDFQLANVGAMADWYLDPRKGLHFQGGVGVASVTHSVKEAFDGSPKRDPTARYSGLGFMLGAGYETFVSDNWSIGGLLRIDLGNQLTSDTSGNDATVRDTTFNVFAPSLLFTGTYN